MNLLKKLFIIGTFVTISLPASAASGFAGTWWGAGEWTFQGSGVSCNMDMVFAETAIEFKRINGYFDCEMVNLTSYELPMTIEGEKLLLDGAQVGTIKPNYVQFTENYNEAVKITTTMELKNDILYYREVWTDEGQELYVITGGFKKK